MDDSVITCDEVIDAEAKSYDKETKTIPTSFNEQKVACKTQVLNIPLAFLLITITLFIAVSNYCYLMK